MAEKGAVFLLRANSIYSRGAHDVVADIYPTGFVVRCDFANMYVSLQPKRRYNRNYAVDFGCGSFGRSRRAQKEQAGWRAGVCSDRASRSKRAQDDVRTATDVFVLPDADIIISGVALKAAGINDLKRFEAMLVEEHLADATL